MSHRRALLVALVGAAAGAWVGMGYLEDDGRCTGIIESVAACRFNHAWLPFFGAIAVGMLVAIALGLAWPRLTALITGGEDDGAAGRLKMEKPQPHGFEEELREVSLRAEELGLERSGEHHEAPPQRQTGPSRIGQRGRPVPNPRRG